MIIIVVTGPSGSGKSFLSKKLSNLFLNSIVIKTDSYYRDNLLIKLLAIFLYDIYDRPFTIRKQEINKALRAIHNNDKLITFYKYDFKRKLSSYSKIDINYKGKIKYIIIEGIFAHRLNLNYQETINIICEDSKDICLERRLKRDKLERGRNSFEVNKKFNKSWDLFYQNIKRFKNSNKVIKLNPLDNILYNKLIDKLQNNKK